MTTLYSDDLSSCKCAGCDGSSDSLSAVHGALAPEKKLNRNHGESEVVRRRDRVLISTPLPLQIQRAACLTNLQHGWPSVRALRNNNATAHHFSSLKEKSTNNCISDYNPGENSAQDPEGILNDHIDVHSSKVLDSYGSDGINVEQMKSQRDSMVSEENFGNLGNFLVLNDTRSSFDGAVSYMNETENGLDEVELAHAENGLDEVESAHAENGLDEVESAHKTVSQVNVSKFKKIFKSTIMIHVISLGYLSMYIGSSSK